MRPDRHGIGSTATRAAAGKHARKNGQFTPVIASAGDGTVCARILGPDRPNERPLQRIVFVLAAAGLALALPGQAHVYSFEDEAGGVHLSNVPAHDRYRLMIEEAVPAERERPTAETATPAATA